MKKSASVFLLLLCALGLAAILGALFQDRFTSGDSLPPYSTLRTDPLGTSVLYESLSRLPGLKVSRDTSVSNRLPDPRNATYLHLAASRYEWTHMPRSLVREIEKFVLNGGRLVVVFNANTFFWDPREKKKDSPKKTDDKKKEDKKKDPAKDKKDKKDKPADKPEDEEFATEDLERRWGFTFESDKKASDQDKIWINGLAKKVGDDKLPDSIKWHHYTVLAKLDPSWRTVYQGDGGAVIALKALGHGSIIFATDGYFLSNEAMPLDRNPALLTWLVGQNHFIYFDEGHLGFTDQSGLASLVRKYRLGGVVVALLALAGLFIWKSASSLLPKTARTPDLLHVPGKDSASGFAALLRRNIPASRLLDVCAAEWRKTFPRHRPGAAADAAAVQTVLDEEAARPARQRDPVNAYRRISALLHRNPSRNHQAL